jgi:hypothetical protein
VEAEKKENAPTGVGSPKAGWRIKTGFAIFVASVVWPVLLPILPLFGVSSTSVAALTGFMIVAAEVMMITAAAIAGKEGFNYIKQRVFGFIKSYGPPREVSAARYKSGLILFTLPFLYAFLTPYLINFFPDLEVQNTVYAVAGDIILLVSLFLLGGEFWDKLRSLFLHKAVAVIPDAAPKQK